MARAGLKTYLQTAQNLYNSGKVKEAYKICQEVLMQHPRHFEAHLLAGKSFYSQKKFEEAYDHFIQCFQERNTDVSLILLIAQTCIKLQKIQEAERLLETFSKKSDNDFIKVNLGIIKSLLDKNEEAITFFSSVVSSEVLTDIAMFHWGKTSVETGKTEEGESRYLACLQLNPRHKAARSNLAQLLMKKGYSNYAASHYKELLNQYPDEAVAYNNLAGILEKQGDVKQAIDLYRKALTIDPLLTIASFNLSNLLIHRLADYKGARKICDQGLKNLGDKSGPGLRFLQIVSGQYLNEWSTYEKDLRDMADIVEAYVNNPKSRFDIVPFDLSFTDIDPMLYKKVAEKYALTLQNRITQKLPDLKYDHSLNQDKIRIGYYSSEFRAHAGGFLVRNLFNYHDSSEFEIHAFSLVKSEDFINEEIRESVDYFHEVSHLTHREIADLINRSGIDILVSLTGYNAFSGLEVLALRPCPVQIVMQGYHETTGASFVDYVFADSYMMDDKVRSYFSEHVVTLPSTLLLNCPLPEHGLNPTSRSNHGLPEEGFVLGAFNHPRKITPEVFSLWCDILKRLPESVLWIYDGGSDKVRTNLTEYAEKHSIPGSRLRFAGRVQVYKHWERLKHADLFLDCFVCSAHFTAIEILRSGKLILTKKGATHNQRLCASILHFCGLDNLIAESNKEYVDRVVQLAENKAEIKQLETKLKETENLQAFDSELQIRFLEKAYRMMLNQLTKNGQNKDLIVKSLLKFDSFD